MAKFKITFPKEYANYSKIPTIKAIRILTGLGLKESKDLTETESTIISVDMDSWGVKDHMYNLSECGCKIDEIDEETIKEYDYSDDLRDIALKALKNKDDIIALKVLQFMFNLGK